MKLGLSAYLGLAIVIGRNSGDVQHKAYVSTPSPSKCRPCTEANHTDRVTRQLSMIETIIYDPTIVLVKTSILLQYVTVFVAHRRNLFHYLIHILIWVNVIFYIGITFMFIFQVSRGKGDLTQHQQAADRGTVYAAPKAVDTQYPRALQRQTRSRRLLRIHQRRV